MQFKQTTLLYKSDTEKNDAQYVANKSTIETILETAQKSNIIHSKNVLDFTSTYFAQSNMEMLLVLFPLFELLKILLSMIQ